MPNSILDTIASNELVIVAKKDGKVHVFKAWKRELLAWFSPKRWDDPANWPERSSLERAPEGTTWAPGPYGIAIFDFDQKTVYSFSDFSCPGNGVMLQVDRDSKKEHRYAKLASRIAGKHRYDPQSQDMHEADIVADAWADVAADPSQWGNVKIKSFPKEELSLMKAIFPPKETKPPRTITQSLKTLLRKRDWETAPPETKARWLMCKRYGELNIADDVTVNVLEVKYQPPGWTFVRDYDQNSVMGMLLLIERMHAWDGFDVEGWKKELVETLEENVGRVDPKDQESWASIAASIRKGLEDPDESYSSDEQKEFGEIADRLARLPDRASGEHAVLSSTTHLPAAQTKRKR